MGEIVQGEGVQWEEKEAQDRVNVLIHWQIAGC